MKLISTAAQKSHSALLADLKSLNAAVDLECRHLLSEMEVEVASPMIDFGCQPAMTKDLHITHAVCLADDRLLDGRVGSLAQMLGELDSLWNQMICRLFPALGLYADGYRGDGIDDPVQMIAASLPLLQQVAAHVERLSQLAVLAVQNVSELLRVQARSRRLVEMSLDMVVDALSCLVAVREAVVANDHLQSHWHAYKLYILGRLDDDLSSLPAGVLPSRLQTMIERVDSLVCNNDSVVDMFCRLLRQDQHLLDAIVSHKSSMQFVADKIVSCLELALSKKSADIHRLVPGSLCLIYVFFRFSPNVLLQFSKLVFAVVERYPDISVAPLVSFDCLDFIAINLPSMSSLRGFPSVEVRDELFESFESKVAGAAKSWAAKVAVWKSRISSAFSRKTPLRDCIGARVALYLKGFDYAYSIYRFINLVVSSYLRSEMAIKRALVVPLMNLFVILSDIERSFTADFKFLVANYQFILLHISSGISDLLAIARENNSTAREKKPNDSKLMEHSNFLKLVDEYLRTVLNDASAVYGVSVLTEILCDAGVIDSNIRDAITAQLESLKKFLRMSSHFLEMTCGVEMLYWNRELIPIYLQHLKSHPAELNDFVLLSRLINEIPTFLALSAHSKDLVKPFEKDISRKITAFLDQVCVMIEQDIRLRVHSNLTGLIVNPLSDPPLDRTNFTTLRPFVLLDTIIDIREYVATTLSRTFYDLTSMNPHNKHTYESMKIRALQWYNLDIVPYVYRFGTSNADNVFSLDSALRTFPQFTKDFAYVFLTQTFVQRKSASKYAHSFGLEEVLNEIDMCGEGICIEGARISHAYIDSCLALFRKFCQSDYIRTIISKESRTVQSSGDKIYRLSNIAGIRQSFMRYDEIRNDGASALKQLSDIVKMVGISYGFKRLMVNGLLESADTRKSLTDFSGVSFSNDQSEALSSFAVAFDLGSKPEFSFQIPPSLVKDEQSKMADHILFPFLLLTNAEEAVCLRDNVRKRRFDWNLDFFVADDSFILGMSIILTQMKGWGAFDALQWFQQLESPDAAAELGGQDIVNELEMMRDQLVTCRVCMDTSSVDCS